MTAATVAQPSGNGFAVLLCLFLLIGFIYGVILWRTVSRHGREIGALKRRTGRGESRLKKLADHLKVVIHDDRDDSPAALAKAALDDDTDPEIPVVQPDTEPSGIPIQVHSALIARPSPVPRDLSGEFPHPVDSDERKAENAAEIEKALKRFDFSGGRK